MVCPEFVYLKLFKAPEEFLKLLYILFDYNNFTTQD